jgi:hypothetical protein
MSLMLPFDFDFCALSSFEVLNGLKSLKKYKSEIELPEIMFQTSFKNNLSSQGSLGFSLFYE